MTTGTIETEALDRVRAIGGETLVDSLVATALISMRERTVAASEAVRQGDYSSVRRQAHSLRSSAGNVGAVRLATLAEQIELHDAPASGARLEQLVTEMIAEFAAVQRALERTNA